MLPDFLLPVVLAGERYDFVARDVPAHVFFYGYPDHRPLEAWTDLDTGDLGYRVVLSHPAFIDWLIQVAAHVIIAPRLTVLDVKRLGADWQLPIAMYCRTVGWIERGTPEDGAFLKGLGLHPENVPDAQPAPKIPKTVSTATILKTATTRPSKDIRRLLMYVTKGAGLSPAAVWTMPISELLYTLRAIRDEQEAEAQTPTAPTGGYGEIVP